MCTMAATRSLTCPTHRSSMAEIITPTGCSAAPATQPFQQYVMSQQSNTYAPAQHSCLMNMHTKHMTAATC
jgi:hypothetical protein